MRENPSSFRRSLCSIVVLFLLGACAGEEEPTRTDATPGRTSTSPAGSGEPTPTGAPSEEPSPEEGQISYEVWFVFDGKLFAEHRIAPSTKAVASLAMEGLLAGPIGPEAESGDTTAIPEGTKLRGISIADVIATVDLSDEFDSGGGSAGMFLRLAQVVYTLTQFPTVEGVEFRIEGEPVETFSGEGIVLEGPQKRSDYEDQLPAIVVEDPVPGDEIHGPLTIKGNANVFEATVSIKVVGEDGETLAEDFTTATCGTGCRGTFEKRISIEVERRTPVIIKVFESSAEDGRPTNVVRVPVVLIP